MSRGRWVTIRNVPTHCDKEANRRLCVATINFFQRVSVFFLTRLSITKQAFCVKPCKSASPPPLPHLLRRHGVWQGRGTGILEIKGRKKQLIQGGDVMRCVFKWMCNKNIFCHWMNGGRFNWISRDRRTGTEWFWQERTAQRSNYSMFTFRMKHLQVQKVVWPNNVVERSQKRRRDGEICHQRFRKKRFCPFFTPWRVNNRICSVISLPYVFSPPSPFFKPRR